MSPGRRTGWHPALRRRQETFRAAKRRRERASARESECEISSAFVKLPSRWIQVRCLPCRRSGSGGGRRRRPARLRRPDQADATFFRRVQRPKEAREVKGALARDPGGLGLRYDSISPQRGSPEEGARARVCARSSDIMVSLIGFVLVVIHWGSCWVTNRGGTHARSLYLPLSRLTPKRDKKQTKPKHTLPGKHVNYALSKETGNTWER